MTIVSGLYIWSAAVAGLAVTRAMLGKSWHFSAFAALLLMQADTFAAVI
jgi:hypothetical protein